MVERSISGHLSEVKRSRPPYRQIQRLIVIPRRRVAANLVITGLPLRFDKSNVTVAPVEVEGVSMPSSERMELPQGTLDLLILKTLALAPQHGWAISERLHQISSATLQIRQGSLYPALHRLERRGWITARWSTSDNNRRAKYYELTRRGRAELQAQTAAWRKLAATIGRVLETVS